MDKGILIIFDVNTKSNANTGACACWLSRSLSWSCELSRSFLVLEPRRMCVLSRSKTESINFFLRRLLFLLCCCVCMSHRKETCVFQSSSQTHYCCIRARRAIRPSISYRQQRKNAAESCSQTYVHTYFYFLFRQSFSNLSIRNTPTTTFAIESTSFLISIPPQALLREQRPIYSSKRDTRNQIQNNVRS